MKKIKNKPEGRKRLPVGKVIGIICILVGVFIFSWPDVQEYRMSYLTQKEIEAFDAVEEEIAETGTTQYPENATEEEASYNIIPGTDELLAEIQTYNTDLYTSGQITFSDAWAITQSPVGIEELKEGMFGYLEAPDMECTLPIYIGATTKHMSKGAAVLGGTSIPIGGENTNSVIAGHRGYKGIKFFKLIEDLEVGDPVYLTNPWGTLTYRVESMDIISPTDSDKVKLQEGKDMITLITCHPYRSHGKQRYVVYCVRDNNTAGEAVNTPENNNTSAEIAPLASSMEDIAMEDLLRRGCAVVIGIVMIVSVVSNVRRKKKS